MTKLSRREGEAGPLDRPAGTTRRDFLPRTGRTSLGVGTVAAGLGGFAGAGPGYASSGVDYTARATFDDFYRGVPLPRRARPAG